MNPRALTGAVMLIVAILAIAGCSRERIDWKSAEAADTQEAYDRFLERHPQSELATQAKARIAQLTEDQDWKRASAADTAEAYRQFLTQHASGKWAEEARIRMENFSLDVNQPPTATAPAETASASPPAEPAQRPAQPAHERQAARETAAAANVPGRPSKPATVAQAPPASPDAALPGYGIQLGAFSTQAAALSEWKRLQMTYDAELHGLFAQAVPVQVTSGTLFRLQSPVGDEGRARSICGALTKRAQPCVVVLPSEKR
jgi:hypothetical protein